MTVVGTYTVETSDDPALVVGQTYPLTLETGVVVTTVESVTVSAPPIQTAAVAPSDNPPPAQ